jgi:NADH-quinone oxidoreductase subunit M
MVNHGFSTAALFLFAAMLVRRRGSKRIPDFGGWQRVTPGLAGIFLVAGLSGLGLPGLASFVSEFTVVVGSFGPLPVAAVVATTGIILAALYILLMYKNVMTGPKPEGIVGEREYAALDDGGRRGLRLVRDLTRREKIVAAPLLAAFLVLGFYPNLALNVINPAVDKTLSYVKQANPDLNTTGTVAEGSQK